MYKKRWRDVLIDVYKNKIQKDFDSHFLIICIANI